jgi:hypothetical protein
MAGAEPDRLCAAVLLWRATVPERIAYAREPSKLPVVLSADEVVRFRTRNAAIRTVIAEAFMEHGEPHIGADHAALSPDHARAKCRRWKISRDPPSQAAPAAVRCWWRSWEPISAI